MAVLCEALSVIVRYRAIDSKFLGGWQHFETCVPNQTMCTDNDLVRVGFMSPDDVCAFIEQLESDGLTFVQNQKPIDITVVDQRQGPTLPTEWLEFVRLPMNNGNEVAACWLMDTPRFSADVHLTSLNMQLATPQGWHYENSLSASTKFVANEEKLEKLKFLRQEDSKDIYLDISSGIEVFATRVRR